MKSFAQRPKPGSRRVPLPILEEGEAASNLFTSYRWGWYALAFFIPCAGILTALFIYDQDSREARKVGRNCLLIGFLVWVVFPALVLLGLFTLLIMISLSFIADIAQQLN
jgi:hypothetical protein